LRPVDAPRGPGRLEHRFQNGRPTLICYFPLGDPLAPHDLADLYVQSGVDVLEIGVPGGTPELDGPVIADSLRRAADAGVTAERASQLIASLRHAHPEVGMVWFTYPPERPTTLVEPVVASGVDGLLLPGSAHDHALLARTLESRRVPLVHFLVHNPARRDLEAAVARGRGYVMLQANPGPSGAKPSALPDSAGVIGLLRRLGLTAPLALGIGISRPEQAREAIEMGADGVVVGSSVVEAMLAGEDTLRGLLTRLRKALDGR
jgi:tryptophan synthase alpha chain